MSATRSVGLLCQDVQESDDLHMQFLGFLGNVCAASGLEAWLQVLGMQSSQTNREAINLRMTKKNDFCYFVSTPRSMKEP